MQRTHRGIGIIADVTAPPYSGRFKVRLSGASQVRVGVGTFNQQMPEVNGVPINGVTASGATVRVPDLKLSSGPNEDLRSWVCGRVVCDPKTGAILSSSIVHLNSLEKLFENGFSLDVDGAGVMPLAMIVWKDKRTVQRIIQDVHFNQRHIYQPATPEGVKAWHLFTPAI